MSRAEVERVDPDPSRASDFVSQARRFLQDAGRSTHLESAVVLYWSACISAMDAVLAVEGLRIGGGEGSHALRVQTAAGVLGGGFAELFERLDEWRRERNDVSYAAIAPAAADVAAMQTDARDVVAAAEDHVSGHA